MLHVCCLQGFDVISCTLSFYSLIGSASLGAKSAFVVEEAKEKVHRTLEGGRKKPCFVCGSLEHSVKQCTKGLDCFIYKKGGHRAKDCPDRHNAV
ncbi:hypothetical protein Lal_00027971 [Lupinus albus]|nr:hypothetical protein Lal_00027971 [Lupinus albus]